MLRQLRIATLLAVSAVMLICGRSNAAWNLDFPFYHKDNLPVIPVKSSSAPLATEKVEPVLQKGPIIVPVLPEPKLPLTPPPTADTTPHQVPATDPVRNINQAAAMLAPFDGATRISSTVLDEDSRWQGNVRLDGWVTVGTQATLTIAPGTVVRVAPHGGINVLGRLVVNGLPDAPVLFSSLSSEPLPGEWQGIILTGSEKRNQLDNLRIEGAETGLLARYSSFVAKGIRITRSSIALQLHDSVAEISSGKISGSGTGISSSNSDLTLMSFTIDKNRSGIDFKSSSLLARDLVVIANNMTGLAADSSRLRLERCLVSGNEYGVRISGGEGSISDCVMRENGEAGALIASSRMKISGSMFTGNRIGVQCDDNLPVLWNNAMYNNLSYNLLYMGNDAYFAGGNWFGPGNRDSIEKNVFSRHAGAVRIEPLLKSNPVELTLYGVAQEP